jgi:hypothetical protein
VSHAFVQAGGFVLACAGLLIAYALVSALISVDALLGVLTVALLAALAVLGVMALRRLGAAAEPGAGRVIVIALALAVMLPAFLFAAGVVSFLNECAMGESFPIGGTRC